MNCDEQWSHGVLCYEQWSLQQRCMLRWSLVFVSRLVWWRCLADSVLASSSAGRCDVYKDSPYLFTVSYGDFQFRFLVYFYMIYLLFPPRVFFQWLRPRSMIVCRSGMWVWRLIESSRPNIREVLRVFKGRSCGRSFSYLSSAWESVSWVFSPVHCGERVLVISLAGQSAGWDS